MSETESSAAESAGSTGPNESAGSAGSTGPNELAGSAESAGSTGSNESSKAATAPRSLAAGFGRLIVLVYVVFAVSAGARALFQVATKFGEAPVSFTLSAIAAVIYLVAAIAIIRGAGRSALLAVGIEMAGVLAVGALSFAVPHWFPEPSVWSHFGSGYGYVPLVLPAVGLVYLLKRRAAA